MDIILVRHGIAEDSHPDGDAARRLTGDGQRKLKAALPGYRRLLAGRLPEIIWSSPLVRAVETARVLGPGLGKADICLQACVGSGHYPELMAALWQEDRAARLLIVGHQPHLGDWCDRWCGLALPFGKGAAALIRLDLMSETGRLCWFVQAKTVRHLSRD
jgi:phosphohistidine phosphatase